MNKLFNLKEFLTIEEARLYLSSSLEEDVTVADIYRLTLDGHLTISVKFHSYVTAASGRIFSDNSETKTPMIEIDRSISTGKKLEKPYLVKKFDGHLMSFDSYLFFDNRLDYLTGVWDLSMLGSESININKLYYESIGESADSFVSSISGVVLKRHSDYFLLKVLNHPDDLVENQKLVRMDEAKDEDFDNCLNLKDYGHQLVVRPEELQRFIRTLLEPCSIEKQEDKPLSSKERKTLLTLLGVVLAQADIDPSKRGIASYIRTLTELSDTAISENTIRNILRQVIEAQN